VLYLEWLWVCSTFLAVRVLGSMILGAALRDLRFFEADRSELHRRCLTAALAVGLPLEVAAATSGLWAGGDLRRPQAVSVAPWAMGARPLPRRSLARRSDGRRRRSRWGGSWAKDSMLRSRSMPPARAIELWRIYDIIWLILSWRGWGRHVLNVPLL